MTTDAAQATREALANPSGVTIPGLIKLPGSAPARPTIPANTIRSVASRGQALSSFRFARRPPVNPTVTGVEKLSPAGHGRGTQGPLTGWAGWGREGAGGAGADSLPMGRASSNWDTTPTMLNPNAAAAFNPADATSPPAAPAYNGTSAPPEPDPGTGFSLGGTVSVSGIAGRSGGISDGPASGGPNSTTITEGGPNQNYIRMAIQNHILPAGRPSGPGGAIPAGGGQRAAGFKDGGTVKYDDGGDVTTYDDSGPSGGDSSGDANINDLNDHSPDAQYKAGMQAFQNALAAVQAVPAQLAAVDDYERGQQTAATMAKQTEAKAAGGETPGVNPGSEGTLRGVVDQGRYNEKDPTAGNVAPDAAQKLGLAAATAAPALAFGAPSWALSQAASDAAKEAGASEPLQAIAGMGPYGAGGLLSRELPAAMSKTGLLEGLTRGGGAIPETLTGAAAPTLKEAGVSAAKSTVAGGLAGYAGGKGDQALGLDTPLGGPLSTIGMVGAGHLAEALPMGRAEPRPYDVAQPEGRAGFFGPGGAAPPEPRVYNVAARPDAVEPLDPNSLVGSRGAVRVTDPSGVRLLGEGEQPGPDEVPYLHGTAGDLRPGGLEAGANLTPHAGDAQTFANTASRLAGVTPTGGMSPEEMRARAEAQGLDTSAMTEAGPTSKQGQQTFVANMSATREAAAGGAESAYNRVVDHYMEHPDLQPQIKQMQDAGLTPEEVRQAVASSVNDEAKQAARMTAAQLQEKYGPGPTQNLTTPENYDAMRSAMQNARDQEKYPQPQAAVVNLDKNAKGGGGQRILLPPDNAPADPFQGLTSGERPVTIGAGQAAPGETSTIDPSTLAEGNTGTKAPGGLTISAADKAAYQFTPPPEDERLSDHQVPEDFAKTTVLTHNAPELTQYGPKVGGDRPAPAVINGMEFGGRKTPEQAVNEAKGLLSSEQGLKSASWYDTALDEVKRGLNTTDDDLAAKYLLAHFRGNVHITVEGAMTNVLRNVDQMAGITRPTSDYTKAGMNGLDKSMQAGLRGEIGGKGGIGVKISDFLDAALGKKTRTAAGNDPNGGAPFVADIHASRNAGFVDESLAKKLAETTGDQRWLDPKNWDFKESPNDRNYEYVSKWGNDVAAEANRQALFGKTDWTPAQVQAVLWDATRSATGVKTEGSMSSAIRMNTSQVAARYDGEPVNAKIGEGATPPDTKAFVSQAFDHAAQLVPQAAFHPLTESPTGDLSAKVFASPESARDVADVMAHHTGQPTAVFRVGSGNQWYNDIHTQGMSDTQLKTLDAALQEKGVGAFRTVADRDGQQVLRILDTKGGDTKVKPLIREALQENGLEDRQIFDRSPARILIRGGEGNDPIQNLKDSGREDVAGALAGSDSLHQQWAANSTPTGTGSSGTFSALPEGTPGSGVTTTTEPVDTSRSSDARPGFDSPMSDFAIAAKADRDAWDAKTGAKSGPAGPNGQVVQDAIQRGIDAAKLTDRGEDEAAAIRIAAKLTGTSEVRFVRDARSGALETPQTPEQAFAAKNPPVTTAQPPAAPAAAAEPTSNIPPGLERPLTPSEANSRGMAELQAITSKAAELSKLPDAAFIQRANDAGVVRGQAPLAEDGTLDPAWKEQAAIGMAHQERNAETGGLTNWLVDHPTETMTIEQQMHNEQTAVQSAINDHILSLFGQGPAARTPVEGSDLETLANIKGAGADQAAAEKGWMAQQPEEPVANKVVPGSKGGPNGTDRTLGQIFLDTGASSLDNARSAFNFFMTPLLNLHGVMFRIGVGQEALHPMNALASFRAFAEGALHPDLQASFFKGAKQNAWLNAELDPRIGPVVDDILSGNKSRLFQSQHGPNVKAELREPEQQTQGNSWFDRNITNKWPGRERTNAANSNQQNVLRLANWATEAAREWKALGSPDMSRPENQKYMGRFRDIAEVINHGTGHGDINPASFRGASIGMGGRSWVGRVQAPMDIIFRNQGATFRDLNPLGAGARPLAIRQLLATAGLYAGISYSAAALAKQAGLDTDLNINPVSNLPFGGGKVTLKNATDTGKLTGDFSFGNNPMLKFVGNVAHAVYNGDTDGLRDTVLGYLRNEASNPAAGKLIDFASGQDYKGDDLPGPTGHSPSAMLGRGMEAFYKLEEHPLHGAYTVLTPLGVQEMVKAVQEMGPAGALLALPALGASSINGSDVSLKSQRYDAQNAIGDAADKLLGDPTWLDSQVQLNKADKNQGLPESTAWSIQQAYAAGKLDYFTAGPRVQELLKADLAKTNPELVDRLSKVQGEINDPFEIQRQHTEQVQAKYAPADQQALNALQNGKSDLGRYSPDGKRESFSKAVSAVHSQMLDEINQGKQSDAYKQALADSQKQRDSNLASGKTKDNPLQDYMTKYYDLGKQFEGKGPDGGFDFNGYNAAKRELLLDAHNEDENMAELLAFNLTHAPDWQVQQTLDRVQPAVKEWADNGKLHPGTQNEWRATHPAQDALLWYTGYVPDVRSNAAYQNGLRLVGDGTRRPTMAATGVRVLQ